MTRLDPQYRLVFGGGRRAAGDAERGADGAGDRGHLA